MARLAEGAAWAVVCVLAWLATVSAVTGPELIVAAATGIVCGAAAVIGRLFVGGRWRLPVRWLRGMATLPVAVVTATVAVLAATLRLHPRRGRLSRVRLPSGEGPELASSRRAMGGLAFASVPSSYIVDTDAASGELIVHELADVVPAWARVDLGRR